MLHHGITSVAIKGVSIKVKGVSPTLDASVSVTSG